MDLRYVVQNNMAGKGPAPAGAEELRYENVFPNLTTGSADMYMDLRNVVQNNLARKGPDQAGAEKLRYENVFPNHYHGLR